jgi:hypothetical protein
METQVQVPLDYHIYFLKTKSCMCCHQPLRHEMHSYFHYRKYHHIKNTPADVDNPEYYVWYNSSWIKVNMETCLAAMLEKRAYAITKPKNLNLPGRN